MAEQGSFGVKFKITIGTVLTAVANMLDVPAFPEQSKVLADMTAHPTSGATGYRTFIDSGVRELTPFDVTLGWDDAESTHAAMVTAFDATTSLNMSIEDPAGGEVIAFAGYIELIGRLATVPDGYKARVRVRPTGAPTIT